jgi:hypothetical protein
MHVNDENLEQIHVYDHEEVNKLKMCCNFVFLYSERNTFSK